MHVIVGLGNPGEKYKNNRHNVGYMVVDAIKAKNQKPKNIVAVKTNVYMNESGKSVQELVRDQKLDMDSLYVVFDDLDIALGNYKIQKATGPKDHNGLLSIYDYLERSDFWHVRVGVDNRDPENRMIGEEYVLEDFSDEESKIVSQVIKKVTHELTK